MLWRYSNGVRCPKCDNRATVMVEKYSGDGGRVVRYLIRCSSCGYREVLQELTLIKVEGQLRVRVGSVNPRYREPVK